MQRPNCNTHLLRLSSFVLPPSGYSEQSWPGSAGAFRAVPQAVASDDAAGNRVSSALSDRGSGGANVGEEGPSPLSSDNSNDNSSLNSANFFTLNAEKENRNKTENAKTVLVGKMEKEKKKKKGILLARGGPAVAFYFILFEAYIQFLHLNYTILILNFLTPIQFLSIKFKLYRRFVHIPLLLYISPFRSPF